MKTIFQAFLCFLLLAVPILSAAGGEHSVARQWNEELLEAIRNDFARPTVHARNLFHSSAAAWDAWSAYDPETSWWLHREKATADPVAQARKETISYALYHLLSWRFRESPGAVQTLGALRALMLELGYDPDNKNTRGDSPSALGNRIAAHYIRFGLNDNANESGGYENRYYLPVNDPLLVSLPGNPDITDPNRYQPLSLRFFFDQAGNPLPFGFPEFLSPEWGMVTPFALDPRHLDIHVHDDFDYWVYHDPGPPPLLGSDRDAEYKAGFAQVLRWSGLLDPTDGSLIDISPASLGNNLLGDNNGKGYRYNPVTLQAYEPQTVPAGDYYRVLAEFWADGPDSETPPGHWYTIANYVSDHPSLVKRFGGQGEVLDPLEWDIKLYFALGGAMHDVAISAWGAKGRYDYVRPVSAIRYMAERGQSSDKRGLSYHPDGLPLEPGVIELVTLESSAPGERHAHLAGDENEHVGKVAVYAWRGPDFIEDPEFDMAGVGWILAENWWPYQRPSFVTPPFAGYVSGHSTYSRAAAELLTAFTGSAYFPGGLGEFHAPRDEFLIFEEGPSIDITLQWASYYDAADECSLSRIYGGIHPPADDIPGRLMGARIGKFAWHRALQHFNGKAWKGIHPKPELPGQAADGLSVISGSWFDPQRVGEGWVVQAVTEDSALVHWLTFDEKGDPAWLSGLARLSGNTLAARMARGETDWGTLALTFGNCRAARAEYRTASEGFGKGGFQPYRLTTLPGLDCRSFRSRTPGPTAPFSGTWMSDHGQLAVEVLDGDRAAVYWMSGNDDQQQWRAGTGTVSNGILAAELLAPSGPRFHYFDPDELLLPPAGNLTVTFRSCTDAQLLIEDDTGTREISLQRLNEIDGLPCSDTPN